MKQRSTLFLKIVIALIALAVLGICTILLPMALMTDKTGFYRPIVVGLYAPAIPFFLALYQAFKLLGFIDKNMAFSQPAVQTLKQITYYGFIISGLFAVGMPYIFYAAERDDAPGVILIALVIIGASFVIGVAAALFQRLLQNAVDIKSENDLTV